MISMVMTGADDQDIFRSEGSTTRSLIRICGFPVVSYFFVSESERYGSIKIRFPSIEAGTRFGRATINENIFRR
jgi:hypothetical protein